MTAESGGDALLGVIADGGAQISHAVVAPYEDSKSLGSGVSMVARRHEISFNTQFLFSLRALRGTGTDKLMWAGTTAYKVRGREQCEPRRFGGKG